MTNRLALILLFTLALGIGLDLATGAGAARFLLRRLIDLVEYLSFWR